MRFPTILSIIAIAGPVTAFSTEQTLLQSLSVQVSRPRISEGSPYSEQNPLSALDIQGCNCTGINDTAPNKTFFLCNNSTLGPQLLPWRLPLLSLTSAYNRFGGLTPLQFLQKHRYPNGTWIYPDYSGFQLDNNGQPIKGNMTLRKGFQVDRFGGESGRYVAAADASFSQRALPPDSLNVCKKPDIPCKPSDSPWDYHVYIVMKEFNVIGGPIAAGFEQPGGGTQYELSSSVSSLVEGGFLQRRNLSKIEPGPGSAQCGQQPVNCACERPTR